MARGNPPAIRVCTRADHPAKRHGHYGYGGAHWCSDFRSPLLSEDNMGHVERGWIVIFEKPGADQ
jgi:hypothetical protein